ncbi:MAG TPA: hypothetical protein VGF92_13715 [Stellaceae bacterium]|jgi:hypothetical protein
MIGRCYLPLRLWGALGALSIFALGGCTPGPDWDAIPQQAAQIRSACETQHPESVLAAEQCANGSIRNLYASASFPDMDVIDAYLAQREATAAQQDRHAISPETARAQYAQALAQENTFLQQRAASRAQIAAATSPVFCNRIGFRSLVCN